MHSVCSVLPARLSRLEENGRDSNKTPRAAPDLDINRNVDFEQHQKVGVDGRQKQNANPFFERAFPNEQDEEE